MLEETKRSRFYFQPTMFEKSKFRCGCNFLFEDRSIDPISNPPSFSCHLFSPLPTSAQGHFALVEVTMMVEVTLVVMMVGFEWLIIKIGQCRMSAQCNISKYRPLWWRLDELYVANDENTMMWHSYRCWYWCSTIFTAMKVGCAGVLSLSPRSFGTVRVFND